MQYPLKLSVNRRINDGYYFYSDEISNNRRGEGDYYKPEHPICYY